MIAGLEAISSGDISIDGNVINALAPMDRDIAMVFQNYALYPHMSVYDNMAFGLKMRKFEKPEIDQRVRDAADILGIGELLKRKPRQLSGGQRQRGAGPRYRAPPRACSCSTSRCQTSMPSCGCRCASSSSCICVSAPPPSYVTPRSGRSHDAG